MTNERILEIARRYGAVQDNVQYVEFSREQIISFAQSVIEADRESSDEPMAWLTLGRDMGSNRDIVTFSRSALIPSIPLYTRPAPARKPLSEDSIDKAYDDMCHVDSWSDFREGVRWAEKMHGIGETE